MKPFNLLVGAAALAALGCSPAALAVPVAVGTSYVFTLTTAQQKAGLPTTSSYATVTLTQAVDKVDVDVRLANGFLFANTGVGPAFTFNLDAGFANAAVNLSGATAQYFYAQGAGSYNLTPYGNFTDAVLFKSNVGGGLSARVGIPLDFSVAKTGISLDDFIMSTGRNAAPSTKNLASTGQNGGYAFAIDLGYATTGKTGGVGRQGLQHLTDTLPPPPPPIPVPEPASLSLLGLGLGGLAVLRRKRHSASG